MAGMPAGGWCHSATYLALVTRYVRSMNVMLNQQLAYRVVAEGPCTRAERASPRRSCAGGMNDTWSVPRRRILSRYFTRLEIARRNAASNPDSIAFELQFDAHPRRRAARTERYFLSGLWQQRTSAPRMADDFSLLGWSIYRIRMGTRDAGGITTAAYVNHPDSGVIKPWASCAQRCQQPLTGITSH